MQEILNFKNSLTEIVFVAFVAVLCCQCKQVDKFNGKLVLHIDTIVQQKICKQTECLPHIFLKLSIINNTSDTVMLHTNYERGALYKRGYFHIETSTNRWENNIREKSFLPQFRDSLCNELILNQRNKKNIILIPGARDSVELFRDIYDLSNVDSVKLAKYLKYCKVVYVNMSNLDSLHIKHPTFKIIKKLISD